jgi:uncharacterized membrane protein
MTGSKPKMIFRILLTIFYTLAGIAHLRSPGGFLAITPCWVPFPDAVIAFTGIAEIAGAIGLMIPRVRYAAGAGLALYALFVWPANINHMVNNIPVNGHTASMAYHIPRMMAQPVVIWLALWASGVTNWPFRRHTTSPAN